MLPASVCYLFLNVTSFVCYLFLHVTPFFMLPPACYHLLLVTYFCMLPLSVCYHLLCVALSTFLFGVVQHVVEIVHQCQRFTALFYVLLKLLHTQCQWFTALFCRERGRGGTAALQEARPVPEESRDQSHCRCQDSVSLSLIVCVFCVCFFGFETVVWKHFTAGLFHTALPKLRLKIFRSFPLFLSENTTTCSVHPVPNFIAFLLWFPLLRTAPR